MIISNPALMEDYKRIHLTFLESFTGKDHPKMVKYITMFLQSAPQSLQSMKDLHARGEWNSLRTAAHSLKPQLAYMGIDSLKEPILRIEEYAGQGKHPEKLLELIGEVESGCNEAFVELHDVIQKLS